MEESGSGSTGASPYLQPSLHGSGVGLASLNLGSAAIASRTASRSSPLASPNAPADSSRSSTTSANHPPSTNIPQTSASGQVSPGARKISPSTLHGSGVPAGVSALQHSSNLSGPAALYGSSPNLPSSVDITAASSSSSSSSSLHQPVPPTHANRHSSPLLQHPHLHDASILQRPHSRSHGRSTPSQTYPSTVDAFPQRQPGDGRTQLFVGNLPFRVRWQDLKDLFRKCGTVLRSDVALTLDNRSKGFGTVLYANEHDAYKAIETYNGYTWQSRVLDVRLDQQDPTGALAMANAAAQQAQQQAHQNHQQAMQNMANLMAMNPNGLQHGHPLFSNMHHPLMNTFAGQNASAQWAAAAALAASAANLSNASHGHHPQQQQIQNLQHAMANLNMRRSSADASAHSLIPPVNRATESSPLISPSVVSSSSRPGTSGYPSTSPSSVAPSTGEQHGVHSQSTSSSPPGSSAGLSPGPKAGTNGGLTPSISPTSARRGPPGSLGPMPPSIFANMSSSSHLPNPPAAAAAAVAAGYSLESEAEEVAARTGSVKVSPYDAHGNDLASRSGRNIAMEDAHHLRQPENQSHFLQAQAGPAAGGVPMHGGLVNFYSNTNGSNTALLNQQTRQTSFNRNTPSPAYANRHLFVGNLPFNCQWQDLKDLFRAAGQILRADVSLGPDGRSRGFGTVLFATSDDAINAVRMFNGHEFQGRTLKVHFDKFAVGNPGGHHTPLYNQDSHSQGPSPAMIHAQLEHPEQHAFEQQKHLSQLHHQAMAPPSGLQDDNSSVPGTPVYEATLNYGFPSPAFPSPGFTSPIRQQMPRQSSAARRQGVNADGVPIAPIGTGAPLHHPHGQQPPPLSPLNIPMRSIGGMGMPSPVGMFSPPIPGMGPMSPQQGLPMMTPSMPGFSFHPFPQTPPLLPQFLSPGLGPFSPPLAGNGSNFFGSTSSGPSGLRNMAPDGSHEDSAGHLDHTPLQSPDHGASQQYQQDVQNNYFPMMLAPTPTLAPQQMEANVTDSAETGASASEAPKEAAAEEESGTPTQANNPSLSTPESEVEDDSPEGQSPNAVPARRASFLDAKTLKSDLLDIPSSTTANRGASLDIPRPVINLSKDSPESASPVTEGDTEGSKAKDNTEVQAQPATAKKSPWNLAWLKK